MDDDLYIPTFVTPHLLIAYLGVPGVIFTFHTIYIILTPPYTDLSTISVVYGSFLLAFLVIGLLKWVLVLVLKRCRLGEVKRCKVDLLIGFGGIFLSSVVPRIMALFVDLKENTSYFFLPLIPTFFFYSFFIYSAEKPVKSLPWEASIKQMLISLLVHFIILVIMVRIGLALEIPQEALILEELAYSLLCLTSSSEFLIIAINGINMATPEQREQKKHWAIIPVISREDYTEPSMNELSLYGSMFITTSLALTVTFMMILVPVTEKVSIIFGVTLLVCILISGAVKLVKWILERRWCNKKRSELKRVKMNLLIGNGACKLFGLVGKIGMFHIGSDVEILCPFLFICLFSAAIFHYIFSYSSRQKCNLDHLNSIGLISLIVILDFIGLVIGWRNGYMYKRRVDMDIRVITQIVLFFLCLSSDIDFFVVLRGGAYLKKTQKKKPVEEIPINPAPIQPVPVQPAPTVALKPLPKILCKICYQSYSETKIPRILKECGHTFCESCLGSELKSTGQKYIACTTCQAVTLVNGSASTLKKNFAILNVIDVK